MKLQNKSYATVFAPAVFPIHTMMTVPSDRHQNYAQGRMFGKPQSGEHGKGLWCKLASSEEWLRYDSRKQNGRLAETSSAHLCGPGNSMLDRRRSLDPDVEKLWCACADFLNATPFFPPLNSWTWIRWAAFWEIQLAGPSPKWSRARRSKLWGW